MSFLKKIGLGILKWLPALISGVQIVQGAEPSSKPIAQTVDKLDQIANMVMILEQAFASAYDPSVKTGQQKLDALKPFVQKILASSELVVGHGIANDALFAQSTTEIAQGVVDMLQSLKGAENTVTVGTQVLPDSAVKMASVQPIVAANAPKAVK